MLAGLLLNLLFSVDNPTQNLLELTIFDLTEIITFSIPIVFLDVSANIPKANFEKKTSGFMNRILYQLLELLDILIPHRQKAFKLWVLFLATYFLSNICNLEICSH